MKKIAIYNGQLFMGGIERVLISYLEKLSLEKKLDITLILKENNPEKNIFLKEVPKNIKIVFIKSVQLCKRTENYRKNKKNIFSNIMYQWSLYYERIVMKNWIRKYFKDNKFDKIIDFDMSLSKYVEEIRQPVIAWVHYTLKGRKKKRVELYRKKMKYYEYLVTICDDMRDEAIEIYPEAKNKIIRIYNPMDFNVIRKKSNEIENLSDSKIKLLNEKYFVGVSRLVEGKNRVALVEIYSGLKKKGIKEKMIIVGEGPDRKNIEKKIKELNLEDEVILIGQTENPFPWMKNAKLFLHTSMGEGFGLVLVEAMAVGTPVIAYDCPTGPREILDNGNTGGLIELDDKKAFEEKIIEILSNKNIENKIIKNMNIKINEFTYEYIRKDLMKLLIGKENI